MSSNFQLLYIAVNIYKQITSDAQILILLNPFRLRVYSSIYFPSFVHRFFIVGIF